MKTATDVEKANSAVQKGKEIDQARGRGPSNNEEGEKLMHLPKEKRDPNSRKGRTQYTLTNYHGWSLRDLGKAFPGSGEGGKRGAPLDQGGSLGRGKSSETLPGST